MRVRFAAVALAVVGLVPTACIDRSAATPVSSPSASSPLPSLVPSPSPLLAADWTEYHRSISRSGLGPMVPAIGSPAVAWTAQVDGAVYASPLIVAGHVIVATENNSVYALDLFSGSPVWKVNLGAPVDAGSLPCGDISPITGITGTPTADPRSGLLYVVAYLHSHHHMLFTLSLTTGAVVAQRDVDPRGSIPLVEQQRGALSLASGFVYVPFGGLAGDCGQYHGYLVAVPVGGGPMPVYLVPSPREAGLWTPPGVTIDPAGNVYAVTGNGASQSAFDYSNSVVELTPDLGKVESYFAPANWLALSAADLDLGSVGAAVLPSLGVVLAIGKSGVAYVLRTDHLGGIGGQVTGARVCPSAFGGMSWIGSMVYIPCSNGLYALAVSPTGFSVAWHQPHPYRGSPIIAAGAVWAIEPATATLYAFAPDTGELLYSVGLGAAERFSTPAATEGFVVAPAGTRVIAVSTG